MARAVSIAVGLVAGAAALAALALALPDLDLSTRAERVLVWVEGLGAWGPMLLVALIATAVVLLVPSVVLTLGSGFLFGVVNGTLYVLVGTTLGAITAFAAARHVLGDGVARYLLTHPRLEILDRAFAEQGWKLVLLTRLVPFFPFKLSNYFFGVSRFRLRDFVAGTVLGIVPITVHNVYLGSVAGELAGLGTRSQPLSALEWLLYVCGLLLAVGLVVWLTRVARRAFDRQVQSRCG